MDNQKDNLPEIHSTSQEIIQMKTDLSNRKHREES